MLAEQLRLYIGKETNRTAILDNMSSVIVIPLFDKKDGSIRGILDMDSVIPGYFTEEDRVGLEEVTKLTHIGNVKCVMIEY